MYCGRYCIFKIQTPYSTTFASVGFKPLTLSVLVSCSRFDLVFYLPVFMSFPPTASISLLILLLNLFHSRVSDMSSWLREENERGTCYRESAESPLWQNNLHTLASPFIYLKVSTLTVCWIAVPVLIGSAYWMTAKVWHAADGSRQFKELPHVLSLW